MTTAWVPLATTTLSSSSTSITFSSISGSYRDLILVIEWPSTNGDHYLFMEFNNDSGGNYSRVQTGNFNNGNSTYAASGEANISLNPPYGSTGGFSISQIMDYSATNKHKSVLTRANTDASAFMYASRWASTAAINLIKIIVSGGGSMSAGTKASLYGSNKL